MRIEALIQLVLALAFVITWFLTPIWLLESNIYVQELTPLGFTIIFLGHEYSLPLPNTMLATAYAIMAGVIPIAWRSSRYSLYTSLYTLALTVALIITALIFQSRYLFYGGYSILSTATGYMYIRIPYKTYLGAPLYILIALLAVTSLNAATRARWLRIGGKTLIEDTLERLSLSGPLSAIEHALKRMGIEYVRGEGYVQVNDLLVATQDAKTPENVKERIIFTNNEAMYTSGDTIMKLSLERGVILALSRALDKGRPGKVISHEYA